MKKTEKAHTPDKVFKRFYFEGNLYFGWVENQDDWNDVKEEYKTHLVTEELLSARQRWDKSDSFGFYSEYNVDYTLGDFLKDNNMVLE